VRAGRRRRSDRRHRRGAVEGGSLRQGSTLSTSRCASATHSHHASERATLRGLLVHEQRLQHASEVNPRDGPVSTPRDTGYTRTRQPNTRDQR
jgi:hypothetical protein